MSLRPDKSLGRAYRQKDMALVDIVGEPRFRGITNASRFKALLRKMNSPTEPVPVNWQ